MRVCDVFRLKWSDIHNARLHYTMGKNTKGGSLKLPEKSLAMLLSSINRTYFLEIAETGICSHPIVRTDFSNLSMAALISLLVNSEIVNIS